jgi:hypothetical protein
MKNNNLIKESYKSKLDPYPIEYPAIKTDFIFFFTTDSDLRYEVRFGRKKDNYLGYVLNFSVLSDDYDEYSETNRGEIYRIISTVVEIVRYFHSMHNYTNYFEFSGEYKPNRDADETSIRTKVYYKYAQKIIDRNWKVNLAGNKVIIKKKH